MTDTCNARLEPGVQKGTCVVVDADGLIVFAGRIKEAPDVAGMDVLMGADDFALFKAHVERKRH